MKILVAGAGGVLGSKTVGLLAAAGHEVAGLTRSDSKAPMIQSLGARPVVADALDRRALFSAVVGERPEAVIHLMTDLSRMNFDANIHLRIHGTRNLVDAAKSAGCRRMVALSTVWVYAPGGGNAREDDALDISAKGGRKRMVEGSIALENAITELEFGVILRYGKFYGPGTWYARNGLFAQQLMHGQIRATPEISCFVHIDDAARAAAVALDWPRGAFNIVDDEPVPGTLWLPIYAAAIGAPPAPTGREDPDGPLRGASNDKAKGLGWQLLYPTWREGMKNALG